MRRILILGAGGFLGDAIRRQVEAEPDCEAVLHFRQRPRERGLLAGDPEWRALDLLDASACAVASLVDSLAPDAVINCVGLTVGDPTAMRAVNVGIVETLVAALDGRTGVELVQLGSAAEYGAQHAGKAVSEALFAAPLSAYGVTKFDATRCLLAAAAERRIATTVLRVFNPLGRRSPARTLPGRAAMAILGAIREERDTICLGSLDAHRDYIDTRDVARAAVRAGTTTHQSGRVLNIGRGEAVLTRDIVTSLVAIAGYGGRVIESGGGSSRSEGLNWQCADITAARETLGWEPQYAIDDSLRDLWEGLQQMASV